MKLSCLPVSYFPRIISGQMSMGQWAREASDIGLDGIDLSVLFLRGRAGSNLAAVRQEIVDAGMQLIVLNTYPDFTHPDSAERDRQAVQLSEDITAAAELGAAFVRVTAGQAHPHTGRTEGIEWAVEGLLGALPVAERCGPQLVYENHAKPGCWDCPDFSHPGDIFLEIVRATAGTSLGVLFDTANPVAIGDDPIALLAKVLERVCVVHASDTTSRGALVPAVIGTGLVPFADLFAQLQDAGFDGWVSMEEASGTGRSGIEQGAQFVRHVWAQAEGSPLSRTGGVTP